MPLSLATTADGLHIDLGSEGGPHGYRHGWICVDPAKCGHRGVSGRAHTGRLVARDVKRGKGSLRNASPALMADRATAALRGRKASDYQHLAAARLHAAAARQSGISPEMRARHQKMSRMHRGIATRTPGRGTALEGRLRKIAASQKASASERRAANLKLEARGVGGGGRVTGKRKAASVSQYPSPIGPNMGEVGKAARGRKSSLPRGKASETASGRAAAYKAGHAIAPPKKGAPPGFPVTSPRSWEKARDAIGRVKNPQRRAAVAALLRRTAAQYGKTAALKKSWAASNTDPALEFAMTGLPAITSPYDVLIVRGEDGAGAVIRHRRGGGEIGSIKRTDAGWVATRAGRDLGPHTRQRGALLELIGTHNRHAGTPYHRPEPERTPIAGPVQTPLMARFGIPAISTLANAEPAVGASDGSRATAGLSAKGAGIYKKLKKRGFPHERAHNFARRAQARAARG